MADRVRSFLVVVAAAVSVLALAGSAAAGPPPVGPDAKAQIVLLGMTIDDAPHAVLGADGRNHLAYEITIVNQAPGDVTIESVQALAGGEPIGARLEGEALAGLLRVNSGGTVIPGGGSAMLFMDVQYPRNAPRPSRLIHAFTLTYAGPPEAVQRFSFVGV